MLSPDDDPSSIDISHDDPSLTDGVDVDALPQDVVTDSSSLNVPSINDVIDIQMQTTTPHDEISVSDFPLELYMSIIVSSPPDHEDASHMLSPDDDPSSDISHVDTSLTDGVAVAIPLHTQDIVSDNTSLNVPSDSPLPAPSYPIMMKSFLMFHAVMMFV